MSLGLTLGFIPITQHPAGLYLSFSFVASLHLTCSYRAVSALKLRSLNIQKVDFLIDHYCKFKDNEDLLSFIKSHKKTPEISQDQNFPVYESISSLFKGEAEAEFSTDVQTNSDITRYFSVAYVNSKEKIILPYSKLPISLGESLRKQRIPKEDLRYLLETVYKNEKFLIFDRNQNGVKEISVVLHSTAGAKETLKSYMVAYLALSKKCSSLNESLHFVNGEWDRFVMILEEKGWNLENLAIPVGPFRLIQKTLVSESNDLG